MIGRLLKFWKAPAAKAAGAFSVEEDRSADPAALRERMLVLNQDPYLKIVDMELGLISVFDELRYDRADADFLSPAMRTHAVRKMAPLGFVQSSGTVIENRADDVRVIMPKFHTQGTSPFDAVRYTPKRPQDFYLLTPTQTACQLIDAFETEEAVERIKALIATQPLNILRILDFLEDKPAHKRFEGAVGHLKYVQREAIQSEPLKRRRGLG